MQAKKLLLIIDAQNDFCDPEGNLYVPGADKDMERLADFIRRKGDTIDHIVLSQDQHQVIDISHPAFWRDKNGKHPVPFTVITSDEVRRGEWTPGYGEGRALAYLDQLEQQGVFPHVIWPEHCIEGTVGAAIVQIVMDEIVQWARKGRFFTVIPKGQNPFTEHFGIVRANIPDPNDPATQENTSLLTLFKSCSTIWLAGQAKSHCVANTIKQLFPHPEIVKHLHILKDCMSPVTGFESIADAIYAQAIQLGAQLENSR